MVQVFGPSVKQYSFHYTKDHTACIVYKVFDYTQSARRKMYKGDEDRYQFLLNIYVNEQLEAQTTLEVL